jgi:hypothetical protein
MLDEMIRNAELLASSCLDLEDLRMMASTLEDMRIASEAFAHYGTKRKCTIFGSARTSPRSEDYALARSLAAAIAAHGSMVITGGGSGIMAAAQMGAGAESSFGLRIQLPFETSPNPIMAGDPKLIDYRYFFARKIGLIKETDAFVAFPGGFGTLDETLEVLTLMQTGKAPVVPLVLVEAPGGTYWQTFLQFLAQDLLRNGHIAPGDMNLLSVAYSVDSVIKTIEDYYRNFLGYTRLGAIVRVRMRRALTSTALEGLALRYGHLLIGSALNQGPLEAESAGPGTTLSFQIRDRQMGALRAFIDELNQNDHLVEETLP